MMRRILFISLAILFIAGIANATNIPQIVEPKNYPTVWTEQVYNGSASTIVSGYVAQWDFATSDSSINWNDKMCPWVKVADEASDPWTAGVVPYGKSIPAYSVGTIIIRGATHVRQLAASTVPVAEDICGTAANGTVTTDNAGANTSSLGMTVGADSDVSTGPDAGLGWAIVFIDPSAEAD